MLPTYTARGQSSWGKFLFWMLLALLGFMADQATKLYFVRAFEPGQVSPVFPGFNLVLAYNRGAAFSFLAQAGGWQVFFFSALAIAIIVGLVVLLWRYNSLKLFSLSMALILSGALGNLVDRLLYGYVIDFLDFYVNHLHWPAFNLADTFICIGAGLMILDELKGLRSRHPTGNKPRERNSAKIR